MGYKPFRGKNKKTGKWEYGNYLVISDGERNVSAILPIGVAFDKSNLTIVDVHTVGQCTGMLDVNGNIIYEGDILKYNHNSHGKGYNHLRVFYNGELGEYVAEDYEEYHILDGWKFRDCEVVGNKYDNPELMKDQA